MKPEEYVTTIVYNGHMINVGNDDYGQQFFLEYVENGKLIEKGCGSYNTDYQKEIEYLFGEPTQCVSYKIIKGSCDHIAAHGYCVRCPHNFIQSRHLNH